MQEDTLIVGIDFGTTYSGVAWCHTGDSNEMTVLQRWPGDNGDLAKVPTLLAYSKRDTSKYKWGAQVKPDLPDQISWFKLLLEEKKPSTQDEESVTASIAGLSLQNTSSQSWPNELAQDELRTSIANIPKGKSATDLVADYLKSLHKHTQDVLRKEYASQSIEERFERVPIKYYLTVPAGWSDNAKGLTLEAARKAGLSIEGKTELHLMSEPEAAAIHCLKTFQGTENYLKVGDVYVLADCGGGTVDLISYEITETEPQLKVKECVTGTHGFCGSTSLNRRFERLLKERLGERAYNDMSQRARLTTLNHFDKILKLSFHPSADDDEDDDFEEDSFHVPVPGIPNDPSKGIFSGFLVLSAEDMRSVFEPTFKAISELVQNQISTAVARSGKDITGVLLVGGFGSSSYLFQYLSSSLKKPNGGNVQILQPSNAWTAVVRGAVLHGIANHQASGIVQSRIARFSYGVSVMRPFLFGIHPRNKLYFHEMRGTWYCKDRMSWFVKKGDEIPDGEPLMLPVHWTIYCGEESNPVETIYCCDASAPPDDCRHAEVRELLDFTTEIPAFQETSGIEKMVSPHDGRSYWDIPLKSIMKYGAGELTFSTELGGRQVGVGPKVQYHHQVPQSR